MITIEFEHQSETEIVQGGAGADPGSPAPATVWHLARVEGRRMVRHPAFLAGCLVSVAYFLAADLPNELYMGLVGGGAAGPALGTLLAANTAELRSRTSGGDELLESIALGPQARTAGVLVGLLWPALVTAALVGVLAAVTGALDGAPVALVGRRVELSPAPIEWLQGPAAILFGGALGVALGRFVPSRLVAVLVAVVSGLLMVPTFFWGSSGPAFRWFFPLVNHGDAFSWAQVDAGSGYDIVTGFEVGRLGVHIVYVTGLAAVLAGVALLRYGRRRGPVLLTSAGALAAVVAGGLQLA